MKDKTNEPKPDVIAGRNPVSEAIRSGRPIDKILVARGEKTGAVVGILAKAREKQIPVKEADRVKLDFLSGNATHRSTQMETSQASTKSQNCPSTRPLGTATYCAHA